MDRILVVDDDALICHALTRILRAEGYQVVAHRDPLDAASEHEFAAVISDFMMPRMNGAELLGRLREANPHGARILLTAAADFKTASQAVNEAGVFRLLSKPWSSAELTTAVRQAVEHHHLLEENERLTKALTEKNAQLESLNAELSRRVVERTHALLEGMIAALDYRDTETQWHSRRVSFYARRLAEAMGVQGEALEVIEHGALLHDIGKIGVRDAVLLKPGPLTPEEWVEMKRHPELGWRMLAGIPFLVDASEIVLQHQERFDGRGYPAGLEGEAICLGARVFAVVDTVDAITSDRPYRKGRPFEVAREEVRRCAGSQFDPSVVEAFLAIPEPEWQAIRARVERMAEQAREADANP